MLVYGAENGRKKDKELSIIQRRGAWIEQVVPFRIADGPVVVLAAAVDSSKGLFVKQADEVMLGSDLMQEVHHDHIVVDRRIGIFINRCQLELSGSHFVMTSLRRNTETEQRMFHVLHEGQDSLRDGTEIVIFHLLSLGWRRTCQRATGKHDIRTKHGEPSIDKKILLFRADVRFDERGLFVAEKTQDTQSLTRKRGNGTQQRDLAIESLARIAVEERGDMERRSYDESRYRGIPCRIASGFEGRANAARGEGGRIRFAADKHLSRKFIDHPALACRGEEGVVLFCGETGHGLEPVRVMRRALGDGPVLHHTGYRIGNGGVEQFTLVDRCLQCFENWLGKALLKDFKRKYVTTVNGIDL